MAWLSMVLPVVAPIAPALGGSCCSEDEPCPAGCGSSLECILRSAETLHRERDIRKKYRNRALKIGNPDHQKRVPRPWRRAGNTLQTSPIERYVFFASKLWTKIFFNSGEKKSVWKKIIENFQTFKKINYRKFLNEFFFKHNGGGNGFSEFSENFLKMLPTVFWRYLDSYWMKSLEIFLYTSHAILSISACFYDILMSRATENAPAW